MLSWRTATLHVLLLGLFGPLVVGTPIPLNAVALLGWGMAVRQLAKGRSPSQWDWYGVTAVQVAGMSAIVLVAAFAPNKTVEREKSRQITLPEPAMTLSELADPAEQGRERFYRYGLNVPEGLADRHIQFPSRELTVGDFIAAIETQSPLRHRFSHCGNGYTILWGGDCSFGLHFRVTNNSDL